MSQIETTRLSECEAVIEKGLDTFYEVGQALLIIRDERLYRANYENFEAYCNDRWGFSARHGRRLIDSAKVINNLAPLIADQLVLSPTSESQVRPITILKDPELQKQAWERSVETAPNGQPTYGHVQQVVDDMLGVTREKKQAHEPNTPSLFGTSQAIQGSPLSSPETFNYDTLYQDEITDTDEQETFSHSKKMHTDNIPASTQWHYKLVWNYRRIDWTLYDYFTIGYSQRNIDQFIELLQLAGVRVLVDARANPVSQYKPDFSKSNLIQHCLDAGIDYWHDAKLGINPKDRSDLHLSHDYESLWVAYDERLSEQSVLQQSLEELSIRFEGKKAAFMCVELDPNTCHRNRIANALESLNFVTFDL